MSESPAAPTLTPTQQAALAKIACGISQPGGVALLCGPQGVGKTTVLAHLASARQLRSLSVEVRDIAAWATSPPTATSPGSWPPAGAGGPRRASCWLARAGC